MKKLTVSILFATAASTVAYLVWKILDDRSKKEDQTGFFDDFDDDDDYDDDYDDDGDLPEVDKAYVTLHSRAYPDDDDGLEYLDDLSNP